MTINLGEAMKNVVAGDAVTDLTYDKACNEVIKGV
jgi:hypothetical protein